MADEVRKPGRPRTIVPAEATITSPEPAIIEGQSGKKKVFAKTVQLAIGLDILGSALSLNTRTGNELEVTDSGVMATSKKNGRVVFIPWSNVRGVEILK